MMLLRFFCLFSIFALHCAAEYEVENLQSNQPYDLNALFTKTVSRFQHSRHFKTQSPNSTPRLQINSIYPDFGILPIDDLFQNSSKCLDDLFYILLNLKEQWVLRLIDSFGKPESGIFQGNFKWVGDYSECIKIHSSNPNSTAGNFYGKYCSLTLSFPVQNKTTSLVIGICIPDSCSAAEFQDVLELLHAAGILPVLNGTESVLNTTLTCKPTERYLNSPAKAVIVLLSLFCSLTILGSSVTAVKYLKKKIKENNEFSLLINVSESDQVGDSDNVPKKNVSESLLQDNASTNKMNDCLHKFEVFLGCFCIFTNGAKLLNTDSSEGQLLCIHGIRFLSMSWVILGHTYIFVFTEIRNILEVFQLVDGFAFQIVLQGFYSVDSFFVLSGFLLAYLSMKEFAKTKGSISWPYFYIHRYVRLTPIYMVILGFSATVYFYMGSGPFWPDGDFDPICRDNWWWNLLYINNFSGMSKQCMGWSWYLANDMQFFIISPLFLISLWRWPKFGYGLLAVFLCASWFCNFFITYHYELMAGISGIVGDLSNSDATDILSKFSLFFDKIYIKPYTRIGPYLIGIFVGYLLFKHKACNKPKYSWVFICIGWIIATSITLTCVYGLYHSHPTVISNSFYNALSRTCFAVGLSWVIYVCLIGQGGFINSILSYKLFIPLSRLTYTAYLIHPMIITGYYASMKTSFEFSHPSVVIIFLGIMVVTYSLALPISLILESPIVAFEKLVRKFFIRKENAEATD